MAKRVGPSGKVVAFEAQRVPSQLLSANLVLNELTNVGVYNAGVGNSDSPLEVPDIIYSDEANFGSLSLLVDWKSHGASTTLVPQVRWIHKKALQQGSIFSKTIAFAVLCLH
mmetsp:Transcript_4664/g.8989  ORF Transcript_4664/g.8989 Transcript_4664/m.8989 type:complete len:112 (+) Transcript_4664:489-824(+)